MNFFNLDCHISVIADIKKIFGELGHNVDSWSVSGHNWVFGRDSASVDIVNQNTWKNLNQDMCDEFYNRYKDELSKYDGFICTYPPAFSMIYEKFRKPIIIQVPIRYEVPFYNNADKWNNFNDYLRKGIDNGMIIPIANSEYDKKYFEFFVERECKLIPSICEYVNSDWNPTIEKFLYSSRLSINFGTDIIVDKSTLGKYEWQDIANYKGIIIIPYNCSTMSIFEYYNSNIPIFCPSKKLMKELYSTYKSYVLSELTWNQTFGNPPGSIIECDRTNDPNDYSNLDIMSNWIDYSDFYNTEWMPYIIYFDSFEELSSKLTIDLREVSSNMKKFNVIRKDKIYKEWDKIINSL